MRLVAQLHFSLHREVLLQPLPDIHKGLTDVSLWLGKQHSKVIPKSWLGDNLTLQIKYICPTPGSAF